MSIETHALVLWKSWAAGNLKGPALEDIFPVSFSKSGAYEEESI
jgi:hypothetical protein